VKVLKVLIARARMFGALVVLLGLISAVPYGALAQETAPDETFDAAAEVIEPAAEVIDPAPETAGAYYVGAECSYDSGFDESTCGFTVFASDIAAAEAFTVYYETVCGSATGVGEAELGGAGYRYVTTADAPTLVLTLPGAVSPSGGTTDYEVEAGGVATIAAGDSLDCVQPVEEVEDISTVDVPVYAYTCPSDPVTLPGDCTAANDVAFSATADGLPITIASTVNGATVATVALGGTLVISSTTTGFGPFGGNGTMPNIEAGSVANFVQIVAPKTIPTDGRLQIFNGTCPTSGLARTEFTVIEPNSFSAQARQSCEPNAGAAFVITGGALASGMTVTTDPGTGPGDGERGSWRGFLAAGSYRVTEVSSGQFTDLAVFEDELTAVLAVSYLVVPEGTLEIRRYTCTAGTTESTDIAVYLPGTPTPAPAPPEAACSASDGTIQLNDGTPFKLGDDGAIVMDLPVDSYDFTDLNTSTTETGVAVQLDATTLLVITETVLTGTVSLSLADCDDSQAGAQDAADPAYWEATCLYAVGGIDFWLLDADLKEVGKRTTADDGSAVWTKIDPGTYLLDTHANVCAIFVDGADARSGFDVAINQTSAVSLYTCAPFATGGGPTTPGIDPPVLGVVSAPILGSTADLLYVTELPSTGDGVTAPYQPSAGGGALALIGLAGAVVAFVERKRRALAA